MKPVKFHKIRLIGLSSILSELLARLHPLSLLEIKTSHYEGLGTNRPLDSFELLSEKLLFVRTLKSQLKSVPVEDELLSLEKAVKVTDKNRPLLDEVRKIKEQLASISQNIEQLQNQIKVCEGLLDFSSVDFSLLSTGSLKYALLNVPITSLKELNQRLASLSKPFEIQVSQKKGVEKATVLLVLDRSIEFDSLISGINATKIELPQGFTSPKSTLSGLLSKKGELEGIKDSLSQQILEISTKLYPELAYAEKTLQIEVDRAQAATNAHFTSSCFVIEAWVPTTRMKDLESVVAFFGERLTLEILPIDEHHEVPPILLKNPKMASPLEFITTRYSLPSYTELDPTLLYFILIPVFYGLIVADAFYAILSVFIALFLKRQFKTSTVLQNIGTFWLYAALPAFVFGIIFDEFGGATHYHWLEFLESWHIIDLHALDITGPLYHGISRVHNLPLVIGISCLAGLLHLALGFILGAISEWNHSKKHAFAKISWLGVEIGGTILVLTSVLPMLPIIYQPAGLVIFVISVAGLLATEGIVGLLELPGFAGNVISYSRIAAIGVVGTLLGEIINEAFMPRPEMGWFIVLALPLFFILHSVNAFIAMFEALIQGGRLNVLEFRSKFMKGGGKSFEPFSTDQYRAH